MKATALSLVLAGGASSMRGLDNVKKFHQQQLKLLTKDATAEEGRVFGLTENDRSLASSNTNFLNYKLYQDASSCAENNYAGTGYGMDTCIKLNIIFVSAAVADATTAVNGGSLSIQCNGPSSGINITYWVYNNDDCTDLDYVKSKVYDGTCKAFSDDDDAIPQVDDRFIDDFYYNAGSIAFSCDSKYKLPNFEYQVGYEDSDCKTLVGYYGLNSKACVPIGPDNSAIAHSDCSVDTYETGDCTGVATEFIDDDNYSGDYSYDDDDEDLTCVQAEADNGYVPVEYFSTSSCSDKKDDGDDACFAGSETVLLESGAIKALSDVNVGDMVQVVSAEGSLKFSEVVFLPHSANTQSATFTELQLASGNTLRATAAHFVMAGECGAGAYELTAMRDVAEGSCVQTTDSEDEVSGIAQVVDHGVYTLVTKETSGLVVVNGVRASSFAHNHWVMNNYYNIHRALYAVAPSMMKNRDVIAANLMVGDIALSL